MYIYENRHIAHAQKIMTKNSRKILCINAVNGNKSLKYNLNVYVCVIINDIIIIKTVLRRILF